MKRLKRYHVVALLAGIIIFLQSGIVEAVGTVSENSSISLSQNDLAEATTMLEKASKGNGIVIVLDPGHDAKHSDDIFSGVNSSGVSLREDEICLKIAQYCKEELEKYAGITVYMTRNSNECPYWADDTTDCNERRADEAKRKGADLYISFHMNFGSDSESGVEIYYPNGNYNVSGGQDGKGLSEEILNQLTALGLDDRGCKTSDAEESMTYPDGSAADGYEEIRNSKLNGYTGIVIEHAFLSNLSDADFLSVEENLYDLGMASAEGVINYYDLEFDFTHSYFGVTEADDIKGVFEVELSDLQPADKIENVQLHVWTEANQDDLKVYHAKESGDDYVVTVSAAQHGRVEGAYYIKAYVMDNKGNEVTMGTIAYNLTPVFTTSVEGELYGKEQEHYRIEADDLEEAAGVKFKMWYDKDGETKAETYTAKLNDEDVWFYNVPIENLTKDGKYKIKVLAKAGYGTEKTVTTKTITYKRQLKVAAKPTSEKQTKYRIKLTGTPDATVTKTRFEVWSKASGKKSLRVYKGKRGKTGTWYCDVPIKKYKASGKYYVKAYMTIKNKEEYVGQTTFKVSGPTKAKGQIENNDGKKNKFNLVIRNLTSPSGIEEVKVKTYSTSSKKKAKWYTAKKQGGDSYKVSIKVEPKYYLEKHTMEVYAKDKNGIEKKVLTKSTKMKLPRAEVDISTVEKGKYYLLEADNVSFAQEVSMRIWEAEKGKADSKTYHASKSSSGVWYVKRPVSSYKGQKNYKVAIYAKFGKTLVKVGTDSFEM